MYYYWGVSDKGNRYEINEDRYKAFVCNDVLFLAIADGFGSKEGLNYPSEIAINEIRSNIERSIENDSVPHLKKLISDSAYLANRVLLGYKAADSKTYSGFGTSLTLCAINKHKEIVVYHTGNTRLYIIRSMISQFTKDFTEAQESFEKNAVKLEELRQHPGRKRLTGALGFISDKYELTTGKLQTEDTLLLCTDGIYDVLSENEIFSIIKESGDLKTTCEWLQEGALKRGGVDNLAALVSIIKY